MSKKDCKLITDVINNVYRERTEVKYEETEIVKSVIREIVDKLALGISASNSNFDCSKFINDCFIN